MLVSLSPAINGVKLLQLKTRWQIAKAKRKKVSDTYTRILKQSFAIYIRFCIYTFLCAPRLICDMSH